MKTPPREPWIAGAAGTFRVCALCSIAASKDVPNGIILQRPLAPAPSSRRCRSSRMIGTSPQAQTC